MITVRTRCIFLRGPLIGLNAEKVHCYLVRQIELAVRECLCLFLCMHAASTYENAINIRRVFAAYIRRASACWQKKKIRNLWVEIIEDLLSDQIVESVHIHTPIDNG